MNITNEMKIEYNIDFCNKNIAESFCDVENYVVCIDSRVLHFHFDYLKNILDGAIAYKVIDSSEKNKNQDVIDDIIEFLYNNNATKNTTLVSIGGGICGDICGYAASIYMRGMKWVNVATTLLSQVDSSVGGKVGVNYKGNKNILGSIYFPTKVIIDVSFLDSLTTRQFKEGLAEVIKHGIVVDNSIITDINKFSTISSLRNSDIMDIVIKSIEAKLKIVKQDVFDNDIRHLLNFGHSFAHAIELNNDLYHGECVFWGMLVSTYNTSYYKDLKSILERFECIREIKNFDLSLMKKDKKSNSNSIDEIFIIDDKICIENINIDDLISLYEKTYYEIRDKIKYCRKSFEFKPCELNGDITIPPSKSVLHRYLIASSLSRSETILKGVNSICDDVAVTIDAITQLNSDVVYLNDFLVVKNKDFNKKMINMKESGSSLRIMLPLLMHYNNNVEVYGEGNLVNRPLDEYFKIFDEQNIEYSHSKNNLPLSVRGKIQPGIFHVDGSVSSQFVSGLLFLLPLLDGESKIIVENKLESLPYVKLTIKVLNDFDINIQYNNEYSEFIIAGNQSYNSKGEYFIEQDYSSRSFFEVAKTFNKHNINILNPITKTLQGDREVIDIIKDGIREVDLESIPDTALILAVYFAKNGGVLKNVRRLKFKESNRLQAITEFLDVMNIDYSLSNDQLYIKKGVINGGVFNTYKDHRVAMALIIASTIATDSFYIDEIKSIDKSFPSFIELYESLGGVYDEK